MTAWAALVILAAAATVPAVPRSISAASADECGAARIRCDLDGDGRLEFIEMAPDGVRIDGGVDLDDRLVSLAGSAIAAGDVDCDGRPDLVIDGGAGWAANGALLGEDEARRAASGDTLAFSSVWRSDSTYLENTTRHIVWDFDGDGRSELVTADYNGPTGSDVATLRFFECTADNQWVEMWSYSDGPRIFNGMGVGDTDRDGKVELIAGKIGGSYLGGPYVGPRVYVFESAADDSFVLDHLIEVDPVLSSFSLLDDLALGDADGDGRTDIAVGLADNETLFNGTFGSKIRTYTYNDVAASYDLVFAHQQAGSEYLTAIAIGDSDNDQRPEIVYFERVMVNVRRAEFENGGFVVKTNATGVSAGVCLDVRVMDTDADGQGEMLCGAALGANGNVVVLESTGNDLYTVGFRDSAGIGNTVLYVDADTSATPPLLAGSAHSAQVILLEHDGGTGYRTRALFDVPEAIQLHEITIGRLDEDGALDLVLTHFNGAFSSGIYEQREESGVTGVAIGNDVPGGGEPRLAAPAPNPMRTETALAYALSRESAVRLEIVDVSGRRVATLVSGRQPAGGWSVPWRGVDDGGRQVASGIYFARLIVDGEPRSRRLTLVR